MTGQGSSGSSRSQTNTAPWEGQQGYLLDLYKRAQDLYGQGNYEYGPDRVTGFSDASQRAFGSAEARVGEGGMTSLTRAAGGEAERTLGGEYLDPESNPWLSSTFDKGARSINRNYYDTVNTLGSRMEAAGRTGSGAHATGTRVAGENLATGLGDFASTLYGGAYDRERGRMTQTAAAAPSINEMSWRDTSGLRAVGQQREQQAQRELDDFVARFQQQQYGASEKLAEYSSMLGQPVMASRGRSSQDTFSMGLGFGCHVAAEFFGWFTDAWFAARNFIAEWDGPVGDEFRSYYSRNSSDLAAEIREDPALREEWRPVFEAFAILGA